MLKSLEKLLGKLDSIEDLKTRIESLNETEEVSSGDLRAPLEISHLDGAIALFSDGACRGNPGPGAWAYVVQNKQGSILSQKAGGEKLTTNNRMELMGAIEALMVLQSQLMKSYDSYFLYTDSKYVVDGLNQWVPQWKSRGWKKADNKIPENIDLWQKLDDLFHQIPGVKINWVKGHAGHPQNEFCDQLCNQFLDSNEA